MVKLTFDAVTAAREVPYTVHFTITPRDHGRYCLLHVLATGGGEADASSHYVVDAKHILKLGLSDFLRRARLEHNWEAAHYEKVEDA